MPAYKLLALDLDGTTLNEKKLISKGNQHWIEKAMQEGVIVTFATGRGVQTVESYVEQLQLTSPLVLLNGVDIWKSPGTLLERTCMTRETVEMLHRTAHEAGAWFWGYSVNRLAHKEHWTNDMLDEEWMKFGIRHEEIAVIEQLKAALSKREEIEVTQSSVYNLEIGVKGITKAYGVRKICDLLGIGIEEVMAIGDSPNDQKLMQACGLAVAMENGTDEIKRIADFTTDTNEEDGVAKAICRFIFEEQYANM